MNTFAVRPRLHWKKKPGFLTGSCRVASNSKCPEAQVYWPAHSTPTAILDAKRSGGGEQRSGALTR